MIEILHILVFPVDQLLVAQCLEHDIAVQASDRLELEYEFASVLMTHVACDIDEGIKPLSRIPPAPEKYHRAWFRGVG
jgi:hypothetical protein